MDVRGTRWSANSPTGELFTANDRSATTLPPARRPGVQHRNRQDTLRARQLHQGLF